MDMAAGRALVASVWRAAMTSVLGHAFSKPELAEAALRHSSMPGRWSGEGEHFERLEFLGDRVISLVIAAELMRRFTREAEGQLTRRHTALVRAATMAEIARETGLPSLLHLAASESPGENVLADALEAVIGAIYLDAGGDVAAQIIGRLWATRLDGGAQDLRDAKTRLQEWAQARGHALPLYALVEQSGPSHAPHFKVTVTLDDTQQAQGEGGSKRAAEQAAAQALLEKVDHHG